MSTVSDEEIERLANRMAMLVSDDGEADNAGRAVGVLARRLGVSGGQLKAIFMAGVESANVHASSNASAEQGARIRYLEAEIERLHDVIRKAEGAARSAQRERDSFRVEANELRDALDQRRSARLGRLAVWIVAIVALAGAGWLVVSGVRLRLASSRPGVDAGAPQYHAAVVRDRAIALHQAADRDSPALATLPIGTRLTVKRTLWHNLQQWVEVTVEGQSGYVLSTDVDLS